MGEAKNWEKHYNFGSMAHFLVKKKAKIWTKWVFFSIPKNFT